MNSIYSDLKSLKNVIYCFVATKSPEIISKILKDSKNEWRELKFESNFKVFLFVNHFFEKEEGPALGGCACPRSKPVSLEKKMT